MSASAAAPARPIPAVQQQILLVEDNPDDVLLIRRAFTKANLAAPMTVVGDGEQAIQYLSGEGPYRNREPRQQPVLMLLDYKLPKKNGLEVLVWVRSRPELAALPIVVLTSSQDPKDIGSAYAAGANSYLLKPVEFQQLINLVQTLDLYWLVMNRIPPQS